MVLQDGGGKLPGKTQFSGRRRITTRKSGFNSHPNSTGGEFKSEKINSLFLSNGEVLRLDFSVPTKLSGISAFGGWFTHKGEIELQATGIDEAKLTFTNATYPNWGKFGSMWVGDSDGEQTVTLLFTAKTDVKIAFYKLSTGIVTHKHLEWARIEKPILLNNMWQFTPEANFISVEGEAGIQGGKESDETFALNLKSCNRCARFLPINLDDERIQLSFSNHCVAPHRRPCRHGGFGKLKDINNNKNIQLDYGYQLECRFCKKFEVNAAHNPQRTSAQMKEDGARRRAIELLLTELYSGKSQLQFRHQNEGKELADYIWEKFEGKCFNCGKAIETARDMHLDHTRPLALLWPLDGTATCLCGSCNSQKRDRSPVEFYDEGQIKALAKITGISEEELLVPSPNIEAINMLLSKLDWFFDEFIRKPELLKEREGKVAAELLVKALQKTFEKVQGGVSVNLISEYEKRV